MMMARRRPPLTLLSLAVAIFAHSPTTCAFLLAPQSFLSLQSASERLTRRRYAYSGHWRRIPSEDAKLGRRPASAAPYASLASNDAADNGVDMDGIVETLRRCAFDRSPGAEEVVSALRILEGKSHLVRLPGDGSSVGGTYELVFSSGVAELPLVGGLLGGYLPNREIIGFDLNQGTMTLEVETLPFVPAVVISGDDLRWDEKNGELSYCVRGKEGAPRSKWRVLYADGNILAARSSVTGLNVIRRLDEVGE